MTIVTNFLMVLEIIVSILLIVVVIAQTSKSSGMGAPFLVRQILHSVVKNAV